MRRSPAGTGALTWHPALTPTSIKVDGRLNFRCGAGARSARRHTREIVHWHFDPETGCPFWLDFAKRSTGIRAEEIRTYDDLDRFGFFQDEWLRGGPGAPLGAEGATPTSPIYTFETGGSTGVPKSRINIEDFRIDYEMFSDTLPDEHFPRAATG